MESQRSCELLTHRRIASGANRGVFGSSSSERPSCVSQRINRHVRSASCIPVIGEKMDLLDSVKWHDDAATAQSASASSLQSGRPPCQYDLRHLPLINQ